jgi:hypothetical protein
VRYRTNRLLFVLKITSDSLNAFPMLGISQTFWIIWQVYSGLWQFRSEPIANWHSHL